MHETLARLTSLLEVGRTVSRANEAKIRGAIAALQDILGKVAGGESVAEAEQATALTEARELLEAAMSHNQIHDALRRAVKETQGKDSWCWIRDTFDTWFVYESESPGKTKLIKRTYVISDTGVVTLGDPVEVRAETIYTPVGQVASEAAEIALAGDVIPLVEKAVRRDGTVPVRVIKPGWGSSGYYSPELLERDGPKVFTKGLHMYWDHPTATEEADRPERSVRDLAAVLESDARWDANGAAGPGLYADAKVFATFQPAIEELAPHIGVSIRAMGKATAGEAEGRKGTVIESLVAAKSVDFVTQAGAGGQVLQLFEAARTAAHGAPRPAPEEDAMSEQALREAQEAIATLRTELGTERQRNDRLSEALALREARDFAMERIGHTTMPDVTRNRLVEALAANPPMNDGVLDRATFGTQIDEAVKAELTYLTAVTGTGQIKGMGSVDGFDHAAHESAMQALERQFQRLGHGESAAKTAAAGRS